MAVLPYQPIVAIRCDANAVLGSGHVMRCLVLAKALAAKGYAPHFLMHQPDENWQQTLQDAGYVCHAIKDENHGLNVLGMLRPRYLVVDHYTLDADYEKQATPLVGHIMVIDDLANRAHQADLLLDQNTHADSSAMYASWVAGNTQTLFGPQYALLREEFADWRNKNRVRQAPIKNILVFYGGGDHVNMTLKALDALVEISPDITVHVVVGSMNKRKAEIKARCVENPHWVYHENITNMAELMSQADLALGAGGTTVLERGAMGLPAIVVDIADNQILPNREAALLGMHIHLGACEDVTKGDILQAIQQCQQGSRLEDMSRAALDCVAVNGAEKVVKALLALPEKEPETYLRPMTLNDSARVIGWRNAAHVRMFMYNQELIPIENHQAWMAKVLANPQAYDYQIFVYNHQPVGLMGFSRFTPDGKQCEWGFYLGEQGLPAGTGAIMARLALHYVFTVYPNLAQVYGEALVSNQRSAAFHKKIGFEQLADYDEATSKSIPFMMTRSKWVSG